MVIPVILDQLFGEEFFPAIPAFWIGWDEGMLLMLGGKPIWQTFFDTTAGRPLPTLGAQIALIFSPDSVYGFLWLSAALRLATAVLTYGIVRNFFPRSRVLPLTAAVLFIANPSEPEGD